MRALAPPLGLAPPKRGPSSGSPADRPLLEGPVALRPRLPTGLPLSEALARTGGIARRPARLERESRVTSKDDEPRCRRSQDYLEALVLSFGHQLLVEGAERVTARFGDRLSELWGVRPTPVGGQTPQTVRSPGAPQAVGTDDVGEYSNGRRPGLGRLAGQSSTAAKSTPSVSMSFAQVLPWFPGVTRTKAR